MSDKSVRDQVAAALASFENGAPPFRREAERMADHLDKLQLLRGERHPIQNAGVPIQHLVIEDINSRMKHGMVKYGTALQAFNGRNAIKDAYEELLDLAMYLRQMIEEGHQ